MGKKTEKKLKKKVKKAAKKVVKMAEAGKVKVIGRGDYRPSPTQRVKGHGDYATTFGNVGRTIGSVGDIASSLFNTITGRGDYREKVAGHQASYEKGDTSSAILMKRSAMMYGNPQPGLMSAASVTFGGSRPRVRHREMVCMVFGSTDFATQSFRIQPGLRGVGSLFPWCSSVANCFQQYILQGAILEFVSTCSEYAATSALGSVMMSTLYNVNDAPLSSVVEVDNNEFTTTNKPSISFIHPLELAKDASMVNVRSVRGSNTNAASIDDDRLDDVGLFQISTQGNPTTGIIGELWIAYDIEFLKPQLPDLHVGTSAIFQVQFNNYTTGATPAQTVITANSQNSVPVVAASATGNVVNLTFPVQYSGSYLVTFTSQTEPGGSSQAGFPSISLSGADATALKLLKDPFNNPISSWKMSQWNVNYQTFGELTFSTLARTTAGSAVVGVNFGACTTGVNGWGTIIVTALDNDFSTPVTLSKRGATNRERALMDSYAALSDELAEIKKATALLVSPPRRSLAPAVAASAVSAAPCVGVTSGYDDVPDDESVSLLDDDATGSGLKLSIADAVALGVPVPAGTVGAVTVPRSLITRIMSSLGA